MHDDQSVSWALPENLALDALVSRRQWVAVPGVCQFPPSHVPSFARAVAPRVRELGVPRSWHRLASRFQRGVAGHERAVRPRRRRR